MSAGRTVMAAFVLVLAGAPGVLAGGHTAPVIVVPGRRGVPIMIEGQDVSGAVIEGEWGLARGHTGITIIPPPNYRWHQRVDAMSWEPPVGRYYPGNGHPPPVGRLEVIPP